ncbi:putative transcription factor bHLH041 [Rutidosis leptorrhynchoides]|uniref:putative transcription factor bHLH041 n=1 Tax=Rutidosis leptorrhynchoides TaxID=125765 RepID=UPI003A9A6568
MDSIFNLEETERSSLLQRIIDSFGFNYVCLWSHFPHPSNCLIYIDGVYNDENNQASSSSGTTLAMKSFLRYQKSIFLIDSNNRGVPGYAFMHNLTYMERKGLELIRFASSSEQLQFYQDARIKTAIFMGCKNGEIEIGITHESSQINFEIELKKLFPVDFPQEIIHQQPIGRDSSSSSSLRSLSMDNSSAELYSPFLLNMIQTNSNYMPENLSLKEALIQDQQYSPNQNSPSSITMRPEADPLQHALSQIRTTQLIPSREHEDAAMTNAILAAISSSTSSSSSLSTSLSRQIQTPQMAGSAFKRYRSYLGPTRQLPIQSRENLNKRSLSFFRRLSDQVRAQENQMIQTTRPTSNQLHHMISERKRREKINESLQALRSLLPPGSKKDKAAVLSNTKKYLTSLKSQVEELSIRNKILEAELSGLKQEEEEEQVIFNQDSRSERLSVRISNVGESSRSESRVIELEVNARGGNSILEDLVVRVLEVVKRSVGNIATVISVDADTRLLETQAAFANRLVLRLRIQGSEWDESSFQEAVRRVLDDLVK